MEETGVNLSLILILKKNVQKGSWSQMKTNLFTDCVTVAQLLSILVPQFLSLKKSKNFLLAKVSTVNELISL